MHIDRQIAIWAGWIAGPAFGVAMMAAPEYVKLEPLAARLLFWGGIIVFLLTIIVVMVIWLHEAEKQKAVLGPILMMFFGALVFCGGAAWYFWPTRFILVEQANFGDKGTANAVPAEIPSGILLYEVDQLRFYNRNQYDLYLWGNKFADLNTPIEKEAVIAHA